MTDKIGEPREITIKEMSPTTSTTDVLAHAARYRNENGLGDCLIIDVDAHHFENTSWSRIVDHIEDPVLRHLARSFERPDGTNPGGLLPAQPGLNFQNEIGRASCRERV